MLLTFTGRFAALYPRCSSLKAVLVLLAVNRRFSTRECVLDSAAMDASKNFLFVASELKFLISPATFPYDYCYSSISLMSGYDKLHWARKTDSASADILTFICWLEVAGCVLAAPFTMRKPLLLFTVVPLNFLLIRMVNE